MKDEEMAEEYVKRNVCENCNRCQSHGYIGCDIYRYSKDSFLAGLKAGRPQWHDLEKDPNDLPKEGTEVLNDDGVKVVRINGHWRYVYGSEWEDDAHLDHWCEIPTFDKEIGEL